MDELDVVGEAVVLFISAVNNTGQDGVGVKVAQPDMIYNLVWRRDQDVRLFLQDSKLSFCIILLKERDYRDFLASFPAEQRKLL